MLAKGSKSFSQQVDGKITVFVSNVYGTGISNKEQSVTNISRWMKKIEVKMKIKSKEKNHGGKNSQWMDLEKKIRIATKGQSKGEKEAGAMRKLRLRATRIIFDHGR